MSVLSACETITLAHEDLECLDQAAYTLDDDVLANMDDLEYRMVETQVIAYQERHKSLCKLIEVHNNVFGE